jgi:hypothetical protein
MINMTLKKLSKEEIERRNAKIEAQIEDVLNEYKANLWKSANFKHSGNPHHLAYWDVNGKTVVVEQAIYSGGFADFNIYVKVDSGSHSPYYADMLTALREFIGKEDLKEKVT